MKLIVFSVVLESCELLEVENWICKFEKHGGNFGFMPDTPARTALIWS